MGGVNHDASRSNVLRTDLVISVCLVLIVFSLYYEALDFHWLYDDAFHLELIAQSSLRDYFSLAFTRSYPGRLFTPLLFVSLDLDHTLFGADSHLFYFRHLIVSSVSVVTLFLVLRLWLPPLHASLSSLLFALSPVAGWWFSVLMVRHYVEGLILAAAALALYVIALRRSVWPLALLSAGAYLSAMLAKEIYVPLPLLLAVVAERTFSVRRRYLWPHLLALVGYLVWRSSLLGTWVGGYGWATDGVEGFFSILLLPLSVALFAGKSSFISVLLTVALFGLAAFFVVSTRRRGLIALVTAAALLLPLIPVAGSIEPRYVLLPWVFLGICASFGVKALSHRKPLVAVFVSAALLALTLAANRLAWSDQRELHHQMSTEGRAIALLGGHDIVRRPALAPGDFEALVRLHHGASSGETPRPMYDDLPLCFEEFGLARLWEYSTTDRALRRHDEVEAIRRTHCENIDWEMPLSVSFHFASGVLHWQFGPERAGTYSLVMAGGRRAHEVPYRGGFKLPGVERLDLRVRYDAPSGAVTYSPQLEVTAAGVRWSR